MRSFQGRVITEGQVTAEAVVTTEGFNTLQVRRTIPESEFADKLQIKWQGFSYLISHFEKPN